VGALAAAAVRWPGASTVFGGVPRLLKAPATRRRQLDTLPFDALACRALSRNAPEANALMSAT
jgi:hypothetical protein